MDEKLLEIREYNGEGYRPLIDFGAWRVALLRWSEGSPIDMVNTMERHTQTDEVFVLLEGQANLILGGNAVQVDGILPQKMDKGKIYNVKQNTWHAALLSRDVLILIVENRDTGEGNTEYCLLNQHHRQAILELGFS